VDRVDSPPVKTLYVHFIPHGYEKTVIDSQVVVPALKLQSENIPVHLLFLEAPSEFLSRQSLYRRISGLAHTVLPRAPRNLFWFNTFLVGFFLMIKSRGASRIVLHVRGLQGAAWMLPLKRVFKSLRIICDVRGVEAEEYAYTAVRDKKGRLGLIDRLWFDRLHLIARRALLHSHVKFCVSKAMLRHLQEWVAATDKDKWEYIPCAVDVRRFSSAVSKRNEGRRALGIDDRLVAVYAGAFRGWQMPVETVECFKRMKEKDPKMFFLCLTPDVDEFKKLLKDSGVSEQDALVRHVPHQEIENMMACGDIGLLLREESPVNAYSCPTKFSEYLACGLFVVTTPAIRDIADLIAKETVGALADVDWDATLRLARQTDHRIRKSVACAQTYYDWDRFVPLIKKWYLELS
jgi:glycosyltransferase involved in cell wall biosynthesis